MTKKEQTISDINKRIAKVIKEDKGYILVLNPTKEGIEGSSMAIGAIGMSKHKISEAFAESIEMEMGELGSMLMVVSAMKDMESKKKATKKVAKKAVKKTNKK
jgi:hypothetical protein